MNMSDAMKTTTSIQLSITRLVLTVLTIDHDDEQIYDDQRQSTEPGRPHEKG